MASIFHRSKQRRAERAPVTESGNINLVPLVDILTSIVFFSLLTYRGATMAALTSFDLTLPPVVVNTPEPLSRIKSDPDVLTLLLAVRVHNDTPTLEHSWHGGCHPGLPGLDNGQRASLETLMTSIRNKYPQNADVTVIPADEVSYANIVHVLERLKLSHFTGISLTTKARGASAGA